MVLSILRGLLPDKNINERKMRDLESLAEYLSLLADKMYAQIKKLESVQLRHHRTVDPHLATKQLTLIMVS